MRAALSDTTVLSNFAHVERPDLLQVLFSPLFVPPSVLQELAKGEELGLIPRCRWDWLEVAVLTSTEARRIGKVEEPARAAGESTKESP